MRNKPTDYSLADFFISDSPDIMRPPPDFTQWRQDGDWAFRQYEPCFAGPPAPRTFLAEGEEKCPVVNLGTYGYLGLSQHPDVLAASQAALLQYGTGCCGSPMLSGRTDLLLKLERRLCELLRKEDVIMFSSGFACVLGSVSGLMRRGDVFVADRLTHMSSLDGAKLSNAKVVFFEHNDPNSLDQVLTRERADRRIVILEGIYSMDGDMARVPELLDVAETHRVPVFVDEAHSILACGPTGGGVVEHFCAQDRVAIHMGSCSKAFSLMGGFVGGSKDTIAYMRCYAHTYLFSAGLPPVLIGGTLAALEVAQREPERRQKLWDNAAYFRNNLNALGIDTGLSSTYIIPIMVGEDRELLYEACGRLRKRGLFLTPIDYPTVAQDQTRFRSMVSAEHTQADLDVALNILEDTLVPMFRSKGLLRLVES